MLAILLGSKLTTVFIHADFGRESYDHFAVFQNRRGWSFICIIMSSPKPVQLYCTGAM